MLHRNFVQWQSFTVSQTSEQRYFLCFTFLSGCNVLIREDGSRQSRETLASSIPSPFSSAGLIHATLLLNTPGCLNIPWYALFSLECAVLSASLCGFAKHMYAQAFSSSRSHKNVRNVEDELIGARVWLLVYCRRSCGDMKRRDVPPGDTSHLERRHKVPRFYFQFCFSVQGAML